MFTWRVSKYNPLFRSASGKYSLDEWTSVSDIGKDFHLTKLQLKEYMDTENKYISAIRYFLEDAQISSLRIVNLEKHYPVPVQVKELGLSNLLLQYQFVQEGQNLNSNEIEDISRLNLRELLWCKLELSSQFFVHFGHDYYLYIGSNLPCTYSVKKVRKLGLFVEDRDSPYREA